MRARFAATVVLLVVVAACGGSSDPSPSAARGSSSAELQLPGTASPTAQEHVRAIPVCPGPTAPDDARCHSLVVVEDSGKPDASGAAPRGLAPADLYAAYGLGTLAIGSTWTWNGQTIAIVDAFGYPSAESDLAVYRRQFGLPPCTTANGCFRKVDQRGGTSYPRANCGWAQETALDVQMASAICPSCKILLVEADTNSFANLGAAVNLAAALGANAISNSYGGSETSSSASSYASYYDHAGLAITVSSGDGGYGVELPAAFNTVVAVGGTSLKRGTSGWTETAWSGAGSGCSGYVSKPSWQTDPGCSRRTVADVSAVADPSTGVSVYDSYKCQGLSGWLVFGGTSVSAPIIAGVYGLAGSSSSYPAAALYAHASSLNDVTSGSNGACGGSYLCTAGAGFDGPTGLGTPSGTGAF